MTASNIPPLLGKELPTFVRDMLGSAPKVGNGVDPWLFRTARLLHPYRTDAEIVLLLQAALHGERIRGDAIQRAVANSKAVAWQPNRPFFSRLNTPAAWPEPDHRQIQQVIAEGIDAAELCEQSPVHFEDGNGEAASEIVELLFSTGAIPDPLLCIGNSSRDFATRALSELIASGELANAALIVPSPMSARTGRTKEGKESEHTLANTGSRRFVVVEFDQGTSDTHAALLWRLAVYGPLALVVHSGNKSLHGWFYCAGQPEADIRRFMHYATILGADAALFRNRSQFVRLPAGRRENGARQHVFYFNPAVVVRNQLT